MRVESQVGPLALADGAFGEFRAGRSGEIVVQELHGRYYEQAFRGNLFTAYAAGVATSLVGVAMVGLQVWNGGPTSGAGARNLVLQKVSGMVIVTTAALTSVVLATGIGQVAAPTGQTAITRVSNNFITGAAPIATATNAGTFTNAPTALINLLHNTAAIAVTGEDPGFFIDLEGSIIIPPQAYVCIAAVGAAAAAAGMNLGLSWEEVPA